jgi:anti-sigma regulatory factor (Ser/Thr protein kinase)
MRTENIISNKKKDNFVNDPKASPLTLDSEMLEHIISVLTNLYSNIEYAVLREYVSNALDSHTQAGVQKPVEIFVPSPTNNYVLTIRDFGVGMSLEEIDQIYRQYGSSTKRKSNTQIGGFGLGGKSALALCDAFTAISIKDGVEVRFTIKKAISEETDAEIPYLIIDEVLDTKEANGFTVRIPYNGKAAFTPEEVENFFIGVEMHKLLINNKLNENSVYNENLFHAIYGIDGEPVGWFAKKEPKYGVTDTIKTVIGGIVYSIDLNQIDYTDLNKNEIEQERKLKKKVRSLRMFKNDIDIYLNIPVGAVKLTPSREDLAYKPQTVQGLNIALKNFQELFELKCYELISAHNEPAFIVSEYHKWQKYFANTLKWRNETIDTIYDVKSSEIPVYLIESRTPKSKTGELLQINGSLDIKDKSLSKTLFLTYSEDSKNSFFAQAEKIRKRYGSVKALFGYQKIIFIPSNAYENKWWNWYSSFDSEKRDTNSLLESLKQNRSVIQTNKNIYTNRPKTSFPYRVFYDPQKVNKTNVKVLGFKTVLNNDIELDKPLAYLLPDAKGISYPDLYLNEATFNDITGMWSYIHQSFANEYTIVLLNKRQKVEKFVENYPEAVNIYGLLTTKLRKEGTKKLNYDWDSIRQYVDGDSSYILRSLPEKYKLFVKETGIHSQELDDFIIFSKTKSEALDKEAQLYLKIASLSEIKANYISKAQHYKNLANKYALFDHMMNFKNKKDHMNIIAEVFQKL